MSRDRSRTAIVRTLGYMDKAATSALPHATWLIGVYFVLEAFDHGVWYVNLVDQPEATLAIFGVFLFISGRDSLYHRKKRERAEKKAERHEEKYLELREDYFDAIA